MAEELTEGLGEVLSGENIDNTGSPGFGAPDYDTHEGEAVDVQTEGPPKPKGQDNARTDEGAAPQDDAGKPPDDGKPIEETVSVPDELVDGKPSGDDEFEDVDQTGWTDKAKESFAKMRTALKEAKSNQSRAAELQAEVERLKVSGGADGEDVNAIKERLKQTEEILGRISLENHPEFKAKYDQPINLVANQITSLLEGVEGAEQIAVEAAGLPLRQRLEKLNTTVPDIATALMPYFAQIDQLKIQRQQALADHKKQLGSIQEEQVKVMQQQQAKAKQQYFDGAVSALAKEGHFVFVEADGNEEWNKSVATIKANAKAAFDTTDLPTQAKMLAAGAVAPLYLALYKKERNLRKELEARVPKSRQSTKPDLNSRQRKKPSRPGSEDRTKGMSAEEAAAAVVQKHGI